MNASEAEIILKKYDTNKDGVIDDEEAKKIQEDYANKAEGYELLSRYVRYFYFWLRFTID